MQGLSGAKYRSKLVWVAHLRVCNSCWIFWKWLIIASEKGTPGWGSDRDGIIGLCQCWQTWHCARDKIVSRRQFIREKRAGQDDPFWSFHLVTLFVRLYGNWLWSWISVLFVDRTPCTIVIRTGIQEPIIKRRVSARIGERQENIIVVYVTLPGGTGSFCRCTAWVLAYVTSLVGKSCPGIACVFPGPTFQRPVIIPIHT